MKRLILLLAAGVAAPALAQHSGHGQAPAAEGQAQPPAATCTPEHAAMGHCTLPAPAPTPAPAATCTPEHAAMGHCTPPAPAPTPAPGATCTPEHAAMGHCTPDRPAAAPSAEPSSPADSHSAHGPADADSGAHAGHDMPAGAETGGQADPHAGHAMPSSGDASAQPDPHAGHAMGSTAAPPVAPPPPEALAGPAHAQDLFYDPAAAARSRAELAEMHGGLETSKFLVDQLEVAFGDGREAYSWDAQFWHGGDIDKLWLKSEGEGAFGDGFEGAEVQALWSHAIDPWFDLQAGIRQDFGPGPDRTHLVLGAQGLAPYWFEVEGALFLSTEGEVTGRLEAEYDLRITQSLILQPLAEVDFSLQDVPELRLGSGFTTAEIGARLRYEFRPERGPAVIAPYLGVQYERAFGNTADYRRADGEDVSGLSLLVGIRTWF